MCQLLLQIQRGKLKHKKKTATITGIHGNDHIPLAFDVAIFVCYIFNLLNIKYRSHKKNVFDDDVDGSGGV